MRAIIIAAGLGSRMGKLTDKMPKCLLKLGQKTILEWTIEGLKFAGCNDIWIITGYKKEKIEKLGYNTITNNDYENNNILHSFFKAQNKMNQELIVVYSDIYVEKSIFKKLASKKGDVVLTLDKLWKDYYIDRKMHPMEQAEKATLDTSNNIENIGKHLKLNDKKDFYEFIGLFKISKYACNIFKETFNYLDKKLDTQAGFQKSNSWKKSYLTDFFQYIINKKILKIEADIIEKSWAEFDTAEDFNRISKIKANQKLISL